MSQQSQSIRNLSTLRDVLIRPEKVIYDQEGKYLSAFKFHLMVIGPAIFLAFFMPILTGREAYIPENRLPNRVNDYLETAQNFWETFETINVLVFGGVPVFLLICLFFPLKDLKTTIRISYRTTLYGLAIFAALVWLQIIFYNLLNIEVNLLILYGLPLPYLFFAFYRIYRSHFLTLIKTFLVFFFATMAYQLFTSPLSRNLYKNTMHQDKIIVVNEPQKKYKPYHILDRRHSYRWYSFPLASGERLIYSEDSDQVFFYFFNGTKQFKEEVHPRKIKGAYNLLSVHENKIFLLEYLSGKKSFLRIWEEGNLVDSLRLELKELTLNDIKIWNKNLLISGAIKKDKQVYPALWLYDLKKKKIIQEQSFRDRKYRGLRLNDIFPISEEEIICSAYSLDTEGNIQSSQMLKLSHLNGQFIPGKQINNFARKGEKTLNNFPPYLWDPDRKQLMTTFLIANQENYDLKIQVIEANDLKIKQEFNIAFKSDYSFPIDFFLMNGKAQIVLTQSLILHPYWWSWGEYYVKHMTLDLESKKMTSKSYHRSWHHDVFCMDAFPLDEDIYMVLNHEYNFSFFEGDWLSNNYNFLMKANLSDNK